MRRRRIVLLDSVGNIIRELAISDIDNADAQAPVAIAIQTQCDMLDWHTSQTIFPIPWGRALPEPDA